MNRSLIHTGHESLIYHVEESGDSTVRKVLHALAPDQEQIRHFINEYEFTKELDIPGVRKSLGREREQGQDTLILEYIDGTTLEEAFVGKGRPLSDIVDAFIYVADALGKLHNEGIIHKDLNGRNILWKPDTSQPVIIDFGISSRLDFITNNLGNPDRIQGTLTHMSPEQTGRVNRRVDSRSDLYSLGVTLYHVLTGALPFVSDDSLEIVHAHIAKKPPYVHNVNPDVPEVLSRIVAKLLSKDAESRYQTALGLVHDLQLCREQLNSSAYISTFELGAQDHTGKFQIPQRLYGREQELSTLLKTFDRVSRGSTEMIVVAGFSGVGKSALIAELYKPITERRGFFISGKFDQYKRNIPYSAIIEAMNDFCDILLTEQDDSLARWKAVLTEAVGANGGVLTDLIPSLAFIIGKQKDAVKLDPQEALNRFEMVFQNFVRAIARPEHPLVLFCDDLQWADTASLKLILPLVSTDCAPYLLVIGAYRDNEVSAGHQLLSMLDSARANGAIMVDIALGPLSAEHVTELISDTLHLDRAQTVELSELVYSKTLGNAFFTLELLKSLNQKHCISFHHDLHRWIVDLDTIRALEISSNVVELLVSKIVELPSTAQHVLKIASSIGNQFELENLARIMLVPASQILEQLWPAAIEGLVVPLDDAFQYVGLDGISQEKSVAFAFSHDRVQQAAYSLMGPEERSQQHLHIGRFLRDDPTHTDIFSVVNHLNNARELIVDPNERLSLAQLNLQAAQHACESGAYSTAEALIGMSALYTTADVWQSNYELAREQLKTQIDIEYLNGNFGVAEDLIDVYLKHARTEKERSTIYFMLLQIRSNSGRFHDAIDSARQGLAMLDFVLPANDACAEQIPAEMGKIITWFTEHGVDAVFERPEMSDERSLAIIHILDNLSPPAYTSGETNLWILHVLYKVNLTIEQGLSPQGGYAFAELGLIFFILGNYPFADPCAQMSMRIVEQFKSVSPRHISRAGHLYTNYCLPWVRPIGETARLNPEFYSSSLECGELIFAGYTGFFQHYTSFYHGGDSLRDGFENLPDAIDFTRKIKHDLAHDSLRGLRLVMLNLLGLTTGPTNFDSAEYTEAEFLAHCHSISNFFAITIYHVYKAYALYINGEIDEATQCSQTALGFAAAMTGCPIIQSFFNYSHSLIMVASIGREGVDPDATIALVEANQLIMKNWADHNEANFLHKYLLVEAELARVRGETERASSMYHQAIASAELHGFHREAAVGHECSAAFWQSQNVPLYVQAHAERAIRSFESMGYSGVGHHLTQMYSTLVTQASLHSTSTFTGTISTGTVLRTKGIDSLDVNSIVKSARALSESVELDALMERLLHIVIENAGAQRAVLIVHEFGSWLVKAEVDINRGTEVEFHSELLSKSKLVPDTIVNYVVRTGAVAHSHNPVVAKNAERDIYIVDKQPSSYICVPLIHKGETNAIVYAEHRNGADIVSDSRVESLLLLTSLMAVALDNALLYSRQSELIKAAQRFVPQAFIRALGQQNLVQVGLGDAIEKNVTVMFGDIRAYSSIAESLSAEDNFKFINSYFSLVGPIIREHHGFINHYYGDGYMALFPRDPADALHATVKISRGLEEFNAQRAQNGGSSVKVGFGIHTGKVMMGIIGDGDRHDANVISDAVNVASRLEGMTKSVLSTVFFSEDTLRMLKDPEQFQMRFIGKMRMVGKEEITNVYELFSADDAATCAKKQQTLETYNVATENFYNRQFAESALFFKKILDVFPDDHSSRRYLDHAAQHMIHGVSPDWEGVETLLVK